MGVELPQSLSEFNLWLTDRKAIWSRHRKEGKADAQGRFPATGQLSSSSGGVGKKKPMGVMDLVRNAALAGMLRFRRMSDAGVIYICILIQLLRGSGRLLSFKSLILPLETSRCGQ